MPRLAVMMAFVSTCCLAGEFKLIDAIKEQDRKAALALIEARANVNEALPDGSTPLAWAAYEGDAEIVEMLLKAGAKPNAANEYGETPLTLACATANAAVVETLLKAGADAKAARWNGETALMIAAGAGDPGIVRMLIERGAQVEAIESRNGQNALMWAAAGGHSEAVEVLVKASANPNVASKAGLTPLIFAAVRSDPQGDRQNGAKIAASLLAAGADVNYSVPGGMSALPIAIAARKNELANVLIAKGADVKLKDSNGSTLLHTAAQLGDLDVVKALIGKGADVNARTNGIQGSGGRNGGARGGPVGEQTPLMLAARGNYVDVMRVLAAAGADPKLKAQDGITLLMAAAGSGHVQAVEYAYSLNPDVKAVTESKATVMHAAVTGTLQNSTQAEICIVVQFLADKGADLDPLDQNGRTPIMIADVIPIDTVVELLTKLIRAAGAEPRVATKR